MDKTERLFSIMDTLRRHRQPVTAAALAEEQGVSVRTLYRDVQTLIGLGAPIDGEAGVGYVLRPGFFLPPLMFSPEDLEALVLGARWVQGRPDESLSLAATKALGKIATASPEDLRDRIETSGLWAAQASWSQDKEPLLAVIREAMRIEKALVISYGDEAGRVSRRTIWPVTLAYYEEKQIVGAWCTT
ncbi:MAG: YafY family transcriptional regulator, partial [Devosia nanyangense]|nr:YafY family transcriptional regulator [Devosia nanyangense]